MPVAPDFRLYHGNDLDVLARLLAAQLAEPAAGAAFLAPDIILIPQPAMRRWLQKTLAEAHGIAANLQFLTPGEFVRDALAANLPGGDDGPVADAATLRWRLWSVLADEQAMQAPVFAPLRPVLDGADHALAAWTLAGEVAAAFEKYQAWRRGWLLRWDGGADPHDWQAELWRRATHGLAHRARRLHSYLQRFDGDDPELPRGLPPRLFAFACQNVSPDVLRVIATAARVGTLHFFFASPVREWWGDLPGARDRLRADADGVFAADRDNPLLVANGAAGRDFINLLFAGEAVHPRGEIASYVAPLPPPADKTVTLLRELQHALLERQPPPVEPATAFDPADRSLQLHACHTPLREVQVLHEQLRTLLEADPGLQPRDIAVLTPDIDAYAPLVHAVFGAALATSRAIPYSLADGSALAAQPLAAWWLQVLALPAARFTLPEGMALLAPAAVLERLGLDAVAHDRIGELLRAAGARWGRDAAHRAAAGAPAAAEFTWRWAIDRLLLGHAGGDDGEVAGMVPMADVEGGELAALDGLLSGLRTLERLAREFARARPAADWSRLLAGALSELLPERADAAGDRAAIDGLRAHLGALAAELHAAQPAGDIPVEIVHAWFQARLGEPGTRQPFFGGSVTFGRMVPMRLIPFRVICLLGMDDGAYPRRDPGGAMNRLAAELRTPQRQPGDRSVREDDRFLFLQLLAAAGDVFYASWLGADPRGGDPVAPSVVVSELIDVAAKYRRHGAARLVVRHPLHPFAPQAFGAAWESESAEDAGRRQSWHGDWRPAAEAAALTRQPLPAFVATVLPARDDASGPVSRDRLLRALKNPARHFLQRRLDVRLPQAGDPLPETEPFAHDDGLHRFQLARRVFAALRTSMVDPEPLRRRLLAEGLLPPGPAGAVLLGDALRLASGCARAAREWAPDPATAWPWRLDVGGTELHGRFDAVHHKGLVQFRPGHAHGAAHLEFGIDHLAWHALGETRPVHRLLPGERPCDLEVLAPDDALARLADLVAVANEAAGQALPFMPKAGFAWYGLSTQGEPAKAIAAAERAWIGESRWGGEGDDPWVRLALRGQDPFVDGDAGQLQRFQDISLRVFAAIDVGAAGHG